MKMRFTKWKMQLKKHLLKNLDFKLNFLGLSQLRIKI